MVSMRCNLGHVDYSLEMELQRGDIGGFSAVLVKNLKATIETAYSLALAPRDASRNMTRHTGSLPVYTADDFVDGPDGHDATRGTFNSTLPSPGRVRGLVNVPGLEPCTVPPTDTGLCPEEYSEDLVGFFWNVCVNTVHPKSKVNLQTGVPLTDAEKRDNQKRKPRSGPTAFTEGFFTEPNPERTATTWVRDDDALSYQPSASFTQNANGELPAACGANFSFTDVTDGGSHPNGSRSSSQFGTVPDTTNLPVVDASTVVNVPATLGELVHLMNGLIETGTVSWSEAETTFVAAPGVDPGSPTIDLSKFTISFSAGGPVLGTDVLGSQLVAALPSTATLEAVSTAASMSSNILSHSETSAFQPLGPTYKLSASGQLPLTTTLGGSGSQPGFSNTPQILPDSRSGLYASEERDLNFDPRLNAIFGVTRPAIPRLSPDDDVDSRLPTAPASTVPLSAPLPHDGGAGDSVIAAPEVQGDVSPRRPSFPGLPLVERTSREISQDIDRCLVVLRKLGFPEAEALLNIIRGVGCEPHLVRTVLRARDAVKVPGFVATSVLSVQVSMVYNSLLSMAKDSIAMRSLPQAVRSDVRAFHRWLQTTYYPVVPVSAQPGTKVTEESADGAGPLIVPAVTSPLSTVADTAGHAKSVAASQVPIKSKKRALLDVSGPLAKQARPAHSEPSAGLHPSSSSAGGPASSTRQQARLDASLVVLLGDSETESDRAFVNEHSSTGESSSSISTLYREESEIESDSWSQDEDMPLSQWCEHLRNQKGGRTRSSTRVVHPPRRFVGGEDEDKPSVPCPDADCQSDASVHSDPAGSLCSWGGCTQATLDSAIELADFLIPGGPGEQHTTFSASTTANVSGPTVITEREAENTANAPDGEGEVTPESIADPETVIESNVATGINIMSFG